MENRCHFCRFSDRHDPNCPEVVGGVSFHHWEAGYYTGRNGLKPWDEETPAFTMGWLRGNAIFESRQNDIDPHN